MLLVCVIAVQGAGASTHLFELLHRTPAIPLSTGRTLSAFVLSIIVVLTATGKTFAAK
jgi:hypothetical protein